MRRFEFEVTDPQAIESVLSECEYYDTLIKHIEERNGSADSATIPLMFTFQLQGK